MKFFIAALVLITTSAFANTLMSDEAVEMTKVLTHPQVRECVEDFNANHMISVQIEKLVARCPMCNTYTITGTVLNIDIPGQKKTLEIVGRGVRSNFGGYVQTYTCSVTVEE